LHFIKLKKLVNKKRARFLKYLIKFRRLHLPDRVKNDVVLTRSLQLIQAFGLSNALSIALVRNWSSLFLRCASSLLKGRAQ